ncbi:hypothetical protein [Bacillus thermotolerans]|uniref:hypothetical protein n=1 Tax=Bacillus thermotolerans TaxID=1221996 RepID=UPI000588EB7E|nr:hypothetical protein [Bacillus thermotolerans]KKB44975.1 Glycoside hydrolase [Bacillus thermotolerans]
MTLRNTVIKGDLILGEAVGEGDVHLEGVTVEGTTFVNGGGENSIYFNDSVLATVIVNKNTGAVRIVAQGSTQVIEVQLETPTRVVEGELDEGASGFEDIVVAEAMQSLGDCQVRLEGEFDTINSRAANIRIELSEQTDIRTLILNAATAVLGEGTIGTAEINAEGSTLSQRPQNVVLDIDGSVRIGNEEIIESYSDETTTTIRSIEADQGSLSLDLANFVAGLTADDFAVTAKVNGQSYELENVQYNSSQQRFTLFPWFSV